MNNFSFENGTRVYFDKGCVKEYLACTLSGYGDTVMLAYGGGSLMNCCKAISMAAASEADIWDKFWANPGVIDFEPLPLGVIVTAAGSYKRMIHKEIHEILEECF